MIQLENKCKDLELQVIRFNRKFTLLQEKGADASKFVNSKGVISGEVGIQGIKFDLNIHHEIHNHFVIKPTFDTYTALDRRF